MPRRSKRDHDGIFARADSPYWWASWTSQSGRPTRRSTGIRQDADLNQIKARAWRAQQVLRESLADADASPESGHTFDALIIAYLGEVTPAKRAPDRDKWSAKALFPHFTGQALDRLGVADARRYLVARRQAGIAPGTINKEIGLFSAAINWANRELGWAIPNPFQSRRQKEPAGRNRWLTRSEAAAIIVASRESKRAPWLTDFIRLGLYAGLRPGEILGLAWTRVDMAAGLIRLDAGDQKSGKLAMVPINREARHALLARARFRAEHCPASPWVFCARDGARIASVKTAFNLAVARAGLTDVHQHDLRRTCGSWLVQAGVDIYRVSELLRHSDPRVTARVYAHLTTENLAETAATLDGPGYKISR